MAVIDLYTVKFTNMGSVKCRTCEHETVFEGERPNWLMLYDVKSPPSKRLVSADSLTVVHECGREYAWMCQSCGSTECWFGRRPRKSRKRQVPRCALCHLDMKQTMVRSENL